MKRPFATKTKNMKTEDYKNVAIAAKALEEKLPIGIKAARTIKQNLKELDKLLIALNKYAEKGDGNETKIERIKKKLTDQEEEIKNNYLYLKRIIDQIQTGELSAIKAFVEKMGQ